VSTRSPSPTSVSRVFTLGHTCTRCEWQIFFSHIHGVSSLTMTKSRVRCQDECRVRVRHRVSTRSPSWSSTSRVFTLGQTCTECEWSNFFLTPTRCVESNIESRVVTLDRTCTKCVESRAVRVSRRTSSRVSTRSPSWSSTSRVFTLGQTCTESAWPNFFSHTDMVCRVTCRPSLESNIASSVDTLAELEFDLASLHSRSDLH
jgi:hypothetical protein